MTAQEELHRLARQSQQLALVQPVQTASHPQKQLQVPPTAKVVSVDSPDPNTPAPRKRGRPRKADGAVGKTPVKKTKKPAAAATNAAPPPDDTRASKLLSPVATDPPARVLTRSRSPEESNDKSGGTEKPNAVVAAPAVTKAGEDETHGDDSDRNHQSEEQLAPQKEARHSQKEKSPPRGGARPAHVNAALLNSARKSPVSRDTSQNADEDDARPAISAKPVNSAKPVFPAKPVIPAKSSPPAKEMVTSRSTDEETNEEMNEDSDQDDAKPGMPAISLSTPAKELSPSEDTDEETDDSDGDAAEATIQAADKNETVPAAPADSSSIVTSEASTSDTSDDDSDEDEAKPVIVADSQLEPAAESDEINFPSSPPRPPMHSSIVPESSQLLPSGTTAHHRLPSKGKASAMRRTPVPLPSSARILAPTSQRTPITIPTPSSQQRSSQSVSVRSTSQPSSSFTGFKSLREQLADTQQKPTPSRATVLATHVPNTPQQSIRTTGPKFAHQPPRKSFDPRIMDLRKLMTPKGKPGQKSVAIQVEDDDDDDSSSSSSESDSDSE